MPRILRPICNMMADNTDQNKTPGQETSCQRCSLNLHASAGEQYWVCSRSDAVVGDQGVGVRAVGGGDAGGGDGGGCFFGGGDGVVEVQELLEEVFVVGEAVGGEAGGVEGGVGVFEGVSAVQFEGAVEGAEAAGDDFEGVGADAAGLAACLGDGGDLFLCRGLRPRGRC